MDFSAFVCKYDLFDGFVVDMAVFRRGIQYFLFHG